MLNAVVCDICEAYYRYQRYPAWFVIIFGLLRALGHDLDVVIDTMEAPESSNNSLNIQQNLKSSKRVS